MYNCKSKSVKQVSAAHAELRVSLTTSIYGEGDCTHEPGPIVLIPNVDHNSDTNLIRKCPIVLLKEVLVNSRPCLGTACIRDTQKFRAQKCYFKKYGFVKQLERDSNNLRLTEELFYCNNLSEEANERLSRQRMSQDGDISKNQLNT